MNKQRIGKASAGDTEIQLQIDELQTVIAHYLGKKHQLLTPNHEQE